MKDFEVNHFNQVLGLIDSIQLIDWIEAIPSQNVDIINFLWLISSNLWIEPSKHAFNVIGMNFPCQVNTSILITWLIKLQPMNK